MTIEFTLLLRIPLRVKGNGPGGIQHSHHPRLGPPPQRKPTHRGTQLLAWLKPGSWSAVVPSQGWGRVAWPGYRQRWDGRWAQPHPPQAPWAAKAASSPTAPTSPQEGSQHWASFYGMFQNTTFKCGFCNSDSVFSLTLLWAQRQTLKRKKFQTGLLRKYYEFSSSKTHIAIKQVTGLFWFPVHTKVTLLNVQ